MWVCGQCGEHVNERLGACSKCGAEQYLAGTQSSHDEMSLPPHLEPRLTPEPPLSPQMPAPHIEPYQASRLAVWVWCLAVFAFLPVLGVPVTLALGICSAVLVLRRNQLPWDRGIGLAGLMMSLAACIALGVWLVMLFLRLPFQTPEFREFPAGAERPWQVTLVQLAVLVVSISLHESAHAMSALWSGDRTAARLGRISLNPLAHVDLFGSIILPAILIMTPGGVVLGWAKPVPIDRRQFRHPRLGLLAVTLSGVSVNFLLAAACALGLLAVGSVLRLAYPSATSQGFPIILTDATFAGIPAAHAWELAVTALKEGILVNLVLFTFNALPIPPLDGYGVLESIAPSSLAPLVRSLQSLGWIALLLLIVSGVMSYVLLPGIALAAILNLLVGIMTGWS